jgi:hypothetical protein
VNRILILVAIFGVACHDRSQPPPRPAQAPSAQRCADMQECVERCPPSTRAACTQSCIAHLSPSAMPSYRALEQCVMRSCTGNDAGGGACVDPTSFGCKLCVTSHCPAEVSACLKH